RQKTLHVTQTVSEAEFVDRMRCNRSFRTHSHSLRASLGVVKIAISRLEPAATTLNSARWGIAVPTKQIYLSRQKIIGSSAVRVQRRWIRISSGKRGGTSGTVGAVAAGRLWKRIEQRLDGCGRTLAGRQCWHVRIRNLRLPDSQALV